MALSAANQQERELILKRIGKYNGTLGDKASEYLEDIERECDVSNLPDHKCFVLAKTLGRSKEKKWHDKLDITVKMDWPSLKKAFTELTQPAVYQQELRVRWNNRKQLDNESIADYAAGLENLYEMMDEPIRPRDFERVLRFRSGLRKEIRDQLKKRGPIYSNLDAVVKEAAKIDQDQLSYRDVLYADNPMGALSSLTDGLTSQEPDDEAEFRGGGGQQKQQQLSNAAGGDQMRSYNDNDIRQQKTINIPQNNQKRRRDDDNDLDSGNEKKRQRSSYQQSAEQTEFSYSIPRKEPACSLCGLTNHRTQDCRRRTFVNGNEFPFSRDVPRADMKCTFCERKNHRTEDCRHKALAENIMKHVEKKWDLQAAQQQQQNSSGTKTKQHNEKSTKPCQNGPLCRRNKEGTCKFDHSSGKASRRCRYRRDCRREDCAFLL